LGLGLTIHQVISVFYTQQLATSLDGIPAQKDIGI